jgi:hypothetical protein
MSESYTCGDAGALVAYLYDECDPEIRESIDAHLTRCVPCAREIEGLGRTRRQLGDWTPPMAELGFQMRAPVPEEKRPWWGAPLPAWAQAAAALLIFGAGLLMGVSRPSTGSDSDAPAAQAAAPVSAASRSDLVQLEQRLRAEMTRLRAAAPVTTQADAAPVAAQASAGDDAIMRRVEERIAESEKEMRTEITRRAVDLRRDLDLAHRVDLASVSERFGQYQGQTNAEIRQQREAINFLLVSQQGPGPQGR